MPRLIWSPAAVADIARLHAFLAPKNRDAAKRAASAIRHGAATLCRHPEIGRQMEDMPSGFREWPVEFGSVGYLLLYRYSAGEEVVILAVRHGSEAGY